MYHPQVVQSPIVNDCLKVKIDGHTEPQLVPNCLFQVSVRELHNNLVITTKDAGLKEARHEDDNIIISDSTLRSLLPPKFNKCLQGITSCVVANVSYLPKVYIPHYCHGAVVIFFKSRFSDKYIPKNDCNTIPKKMAYCWSFEYLNPIPEESRNWVPRSNMCPGNPITSQQAIVFADSSLLLL